VPSPIQHDPATYHIYAADTEVSEAGQDGDDAEEVARTVSETETCEFRKVQFRRAMVQRSCVPSAGMSTRQAPSSVRTRESRTRSWSPAANRRTRSIVRVRRSVGHRLSACSSRFEIRSTVRNR